VNKKQSRLQRARKTRIRIAEQGAARLCINRTNSHIYVQLIDGTGTKVLAAASSNEKDLRAQLKNGGNKAAATLVGSKIAERAKALGITTAAFDRSGFQYHGRVKALADAAREAGLTI
jgi:large subunit ribosomal protein L18